MRRLPVPLIIDVIGHLVQHARKKYRTRKLDRVTTAVVHHSAAPAREDGNHYKQLEAFAAYHVGSHDWPGIGYHYVIDPAGQVYKCNPLTRRTWHCPGANTSGVGICLMGDFRYTEPTEKQIMALLGLVEELRKGLPHLRQVIGHYDKVATTCPGPLFLGALEKHLDKAPPRVQKLIQIAA